MSFCDSFNKLLEKRIVIFDGAMGTMLRRRSHNIGESVIIPDTLNISAPERVVTLHLDYLKAGADVITTNSFNSNAISLKNFGVSEDSYSLAFAAASLGRKAIANFRVGREDSEVFLAGSIGPVYDPSLTAHPADENRMEHHKLAYKNQIKGLVDGGADLLLLETMVSLNDIRSFKKAKEELIREGVIKDLPVILSLCLIDDNISFQGIKIIDLWEEINGLNLMAIGVNCTSCSFAIRETLQELKDRFSLPVYFSPNAGLPDPAGEYEVSPEEFANNLILYIQSGLIDMAGGCCGTTPDHISMLYHGLK